MPLLPSLIHLLLRVSINDKEVKVNIFDMAGHPVFYEVHTNTNNYCICSYSVCVLKFTVAAAGDFFFCLEVCSCSKVGTFTIYGINHFSCDN